MAQPDFSSLAEASEAFDKLQADFAASEQLAQESATEIANLKEERDAWMNTVSIISSDERVEALTAELATASEKVAALESEIAALKAEAKTAEQRAAEIAGTAGIAAVSATPGATAENAWEKYQAIKDPAEKTAYWRANSESIIKAARNA